MDTIYVELGRRLRSARTKAGMTQRELARRVGLSRTSITNIERGFQHISVATLYTLASALQTDPTKLLPQSSVNGNSSVHLSMIENSKLPTTDKRILKDLVHTLVESGGKAR